jgi:hypothetical protein
MGFLDILASKAFQTDQDGRRIYYPGPLSQGFIIQSEAEFQRLRKNLKIFHALIFLYFLGLVALIPVISRQAGLKGGILGIYFFMPYEIWLYYQGHHLKRADEGLTFHERIAKRAARVPFEVLLIYEMMSLGIVAAGIFIIWADWRHWVYSLASMIAIGFFGYRAIIVAKMLIAKRQQRNGNL